MPYADRAGDRLRPGPAGYSDGMSTGLAEHEHVWHLQAVHLEEGLSTQEFACEACGAVDFR
ncbi:hypothetical protein ACVW2K_001912 [Nocardioides sp. HB32]|jgi:hypothetical protein